MCQKIKRSLYEEGLYMTKWEGCDFLDRRGSVVEVAEQTLAKNAK